MPKLKLLSLSAVMGLAAMVVGQPLQLNTIAHSFTPVSGSPYVADVKGWTDPIGRDFALICRANNGLNIWEVTNPSAPVFAANVAATGSDLKDIDIIADRYAYAVQQSGSTLVIDLLNPYAPVVVTSIAGGAHTGFYYEEMNLYLQGRNGASPFDARIYDVTNPAAPVFLGSYPVPNGEQSHDTYAQDGLMYVSTLFGATAGTDIVDISNPSTPIFISQINSTEFSGDYSHSSWLYNAPGNHKYLVTCNERAGGYLKIFDVTSSTSTPLVGFWQSATGAPISIHNPQVVDRYCFVSYYSDYLRILDLANPAQPLEVGIYDPFPNNAGQSVFDGSWAVHCYKKLANGSYRVVMAESFNAPLGFWILTFTPPPHLDLILTTTGVGDVTIDVRGADAFTEVLNPISTTTTQLFGSGPLGGLQSDAFFTLLFPFPTPPFRDACNASGNYLFALPAGSLPPGLSVDLRSIARKSGAFMLSELGRVTF